MSEAVRRVTAEVERRKLEQALKQADCGQRDDRSGLDGRDGARLGRILLQRKVRARAMGVVDLGAEHTSQVSLVEHHDVVETRAATRADQAFHVRILPR